jgi:hypothetical protein
MRRAFSLAIASLVVLLFSAAHAQAQTVTWTAQLSGGNEVPGVVTGAAGTATVTWNFATHTGTYRVDVYNFAVGVTASHIHAGAPGVAGPVVINFAPVLGTSNDFGFSGNISCASDFVPRQAQGIGSCEDFEQMMMLDNAYVNVHSGLNPGGEIRGQIVRQR